MINYELKFNRGHGEPEHFFVGDLHYNHNKDFIWGCPKRGYNNLHEMNTDIIKQWNTTATNDDIVWHTGDTIFRDHDGTECLALYDVLNFKVLYEMWGNHRSGVKAIYKNLCEERGLVDVEQYPMEMEISPGKKVIFIGHYSEITIDGQSIILSHYPIESWNGIGKKAWNIHGHTHRNLDNIKGVKRIDVGWDYKRKPLSFPELRTEMKTLGGKPGDHHQ
jgi:calcineurin-like phosphoesterase family protein